MAVKITYFVHGTTTDNLEHKATGWLPGELSQKGIEQSIALREQINISYSSLNPCAAPKFSLGYTNIKLECYIRNCKEVKEKIIRLF